MCRITGFWDFRYKHNYSISNTIHSMKDTMIHGGADDQGIYLDSLASLALGHRRLSVLDLSSLGHQPMTYDSLTIVYNGEVYNFQEIRQELEKEGYSFSSTSDTEVVLKAYHCWGKKSLSRFRGMWAFAIWNSKKQKLFLCRDRIGVKPLYWYYKNNLFMFSSELKSFHQHPHFQKEMDPKALSLYLHYGYISAPFSIFKHTYKLEPACFLEIDSKHKIYQQKYWNLLPFFSLEKNGSKSEDEMMEELEDILQESFGLRMVSDVPVGVFLSGGIDSTLVTTLLQKQSTQPLKTFTIGFHEKEYNEATFAKKISHYLGTDHTELYCTPQDALEVIFKLPEIYDEPFGDPSAIPTFLVSKLAKNQVKVSLSADGGDEQFFGYSIYHKMKNLQNKIENPFWNPFFSFIQCIHPDIAFSIYKELEFILPKWNHFKDTYTKLQYLLREKSPASQYNVSIQHFLDGDLKKHFLPKINHFFKYPTSLNHLNPSKQMMLMDLETYLPDNILVKIDRASMAVGLEARDPFLDHKLLEYTSSLPLKWKIKKRNSKYILKKILAKHLPRKLFERPKQGFAIPLQKWFQEDLKELYREYLGHPKDGFLQKEITQKMVQEYVNNQGRNGSKLWLLFVFELWRRKWNV